MLEEICDHKLPQVGVRKVPAHNAKRIAFQQEGRVTLVEEKMIRHSTPIDRVKRNNLPSPA
jgi:hypothetical protein